METKSDEYDIQYLNTLDDFLNSTNLSKEDVCLVGSAVLADNNLRDNRDLDIALDPHNQSEIMSKEIPEGIEISSEKYSWLGVTNRDLVYNDQYHYHSHNFKIIKPELELSFKHRRHWEKDKHDIELIEDRFVNVDDYDWDWELFSYEFYPEVIGYRGLPNSSQIQQSLIARFEEKARKDGLFPALQSAVGVVGGTIPVISEFVNSRDSNSSPSTVDNKTLYFIAWPTVSEFFDVLAQHLDAELGVVSTENIFLGDEIGQFVHDLYNFNNEGRLIEYKSWKISNDGDEILIIETQAPVTDSGEVDERFISNFKDQIRKRYYPYVSDDSFHNIIHGPDSIDENKWIKKTIKRY